MDFTIIAAIITLGLLGLLFGGGLAYASKKFAVKVDPRVEMINEILPGANCGGCGYPGCSGYAEAVVQGRADPTLCSPGGNEVAKKIAAILGVEAQAMESMVCVVQCRGGREEAQEKFVYYGPSDCNSAVLLSGGSKACVYGCLGLGSCEAACPYGAIKINDNSIPVVDEELCTGCGLCVSVCPKGITKLVPRSQKVYVACVNKDRGKSVKEVCSVGCTGCTLCANPKTTLSGKVKIEDNLPVIPADWDDYETAVQKCPAKCLIVRGTAVPEKLEKAEAEKKA